MKDSANLYIDESGVGNISYLTYKYFIMSSVTMTKSEEEKASSFFTYWKWKYTINPSTSFHSTDFFENHVYKRGKKKGKLIAYRKKNLNKFDKFKVAVEELLKLVTYLKFKSNVYYVDLNKVLKILGLNRKFSPVIKDIINREYGHEILLPIFTVSKFLYKDHEKSLVNKRIKQGFVYYESQKENDIEIVRSFHEHLQKISQTSKTYIYGKNVLGLNFFNKASLCSGLEIADLIAYSTNQVLRSKRAKSELASFDKQRLSLLLKMFERIKKHFKIKIYDVTNDSINDFKQIKKRIVDQRADRKARKTKKASKS